VTPSKRRGLGRHPIVRPATGFARLLLASAMLGCPLLAAAPQAAEPSPDPRVAEANALLDSRGEWDRALGLYRDALRDHPEDYSARVWLARLLSWDGKYDDASAEYERLIEAGYEPVLMRTERAEVLSWAGQYRQAESAFQAVLVEKPDDARAERGLARVYRWSNRLALAERAYFRALEIEDDPEAARELQELQARRGTRGESRNHGFTDNDDMIVWSSEAWAASDLDFDTRLLASARFSRVELDRRRPQIDLGSGPVDDPRPTSAEGFSFLIGFERDLLPTLKLRAEGGMRTWTHASDHGLARLNLELQANEATTLSFGVDYDDMLAESISLDAVLAGLDHTSLRTTLYHALAQDSGIFGYLEGGFVSDGNRRLAFGASYEVPVWKPLGLFAGAGGSFERYFRNGTDYYDPSVDVSAEAQMRMSVDVLGFADLEARAALGFGHAKQDGVAGSGLNFGVSGGPVLHYGAWWGSAVAAYGESQRSRAYRYYDFSLKFGRSF